MSDASKGSGPALPPMPDPGSDPDARAWEGMRAEFASRKPPRWWPVGVMWLLGAALLFLFVRNVYYQIDDFLLTLFISFFLALALEPIVNFFARRGWRRGVTTFAVFLVSVLLALGFVVLSSVFFYQQVTQLLEILPQAIASVVDWVNSTFDTDIDLTQLEDEIAEGPIRDWAQYLASGAVGFASSALGLVFQAFTVFLFTFYMVAEGPRFRRTVLSIFKPHTQQTVLYAWEVAIDRTGGYIISRGFLALMSAVISAVVFLLLGLPSAIFLGIFVGLVSQFVPTIGTYIAGALPVLVAIFEGQWWKPVVVLVFILVYQQVENYVFSPMITARTVEIHPAVAFGSVMVGAAMLGGIGALIAIPAAATIQTILAQLVFRRRYEVVDAALLEQPELAIREAKKAAKSGPRGLVGNALQVSASRARSDQAMALEMRARSLEASARQSLADAERFRAQGTPEGDVAADAKVQEAREFAEEAKQAREEAGPDEG